MRQKYFLLICKTNLGSRLGRQTGSSLQECLVALSSCMRWEMIFLCPLNLVLSHLTKFSKCLLRANSPPVHNPYKVSKKHAYKKKKKTRWRPEKTSSTGNLRAPVSHWNNSWYLQGAVPGAAKTLVLANLIPTD